MDSRANVGEVKENYQLVHNAHLEPVPGTCPRNEPLLCKTRENHPPGHSSRGSIQWKDWEKSQVGPNSMRRVNVHLRRKRPGHEPMHKGASFHRRMTAFVELSTPEDHKRPLPPTLSPQQHIPLLPAPSTWTLGSCSPVSPPIVDLLQALALHNFLASLHLSGQPHLRNNQSSDWYGGDSALRSARRANVHLFREQLGYEPMHEGASPYPPMPTLSVSPGIPRQAVESSPQGPKRPLLPAPSPLQRVPLLPVPSASTSTFCSCQRPVFPSIPSNTNNPFSLPPPYPNGGQPFTRPPPIPPSLIPPRPRPDQGNQKPSPMVSSPVPSSPSPSYPISFHNPFTIPQPIAPHPLFSSFRGHFERRNSVPPSFPPPTQPPFISRQMAPPFVLRPSTLFPKPPPSAGPSQ